MHCTNSMSEAFFKSTLINRISAIFHGSDAIFEPIFEFPIIFWPINIFFLNLFLLRIFRIRLSRHFIVNFIDIWTINLLCFINNFFLNRAFYTIFLKKLQKIVDFDLASLKKRNFAISIWSGSQIYIRAICNSLSLLANSLKNCSH